MAYIGPEPNPGQNREVDDISSSFNGSLTDFTLQVNSQNVSPGSSNAIIVSVGGVVQNPGTDYTVAASTLTFTTAPASGLSFFGLVLGQQIDTEGFADGGTLNNPVITGDLSIADKIVHTGDTNTAIRFAGNDIITAEIAGTETLRIDGTGLKIVDKLLHSGDTDTMIRFPAADTITAETGGSERVRIMSDGRVGVGTSPDSGIQLHVQKSGEANIILEGDVNGQGGFFMLKNNSDNANTTMSIQNLDAGGQGTSEITFQNVNNANNEGLMKFSTRPSGGSMTERMRIDSSGRLLVGKSATKASDGENTAITQIESTGSCMVDIAANGTNSSNHYAALNLIRSDGTSVNSHTAVDSGDIIGRLQWIGADGSDRFNSCAAIFASAASDFTANNCPANLIFSTNPGGATPSERMRITSSGKVGIGTTNPDRFFDVIKGAAYIARVQQTTNNQGDEYACLTLRHAAATSGQNGVGITFQNTGGSAVGKIDFGQSTTQYRTSSDYRLKENAVSISDGITRLKTLKPYRFNFIAEPDRTVDGFFAHEVTAVPEAIGGTKDEVETTYYKDSDTIPEGKVVGDVKDTASPVYQGIDQSKLVPLLTAALQEAITKIETLETKVAALEAA